MLRTLTACLLVSSSFAGAQDTNCPAYPRQVRTVMESALGRDRALEIYARGAGSRTRQSAITTPASKNFIDDGVFGKMRADNVQPAILTTDNEFLRRVYLDLTGRIPDPDQAAAFLQSTATDRRARLVETLLASPAYTDQFSHWLLRRLRVTRQNNLVGYEERNHFYDFVRQFVAADGAYDEFVRNLITATGDTDVTPAIAYTAHLFNKDGPPQDTWDDITDAYTTQFLGFTTSCISCHNGRGHLENINLFLAPRRRQEFWQLSAFFSRTQFRIVGDDDAFYRPRVILSDPSTGLYTGAINPSQPGARPSRAGAAVTPLYWLSGNTQPASDAWRFEWAKVMTADRQFARASVNYLWANFFGSGIVDPPDGWDLRRVDPANPPPTGWPTQNTNPALLEALTDQFIQSGYSLKSVTRLIVNSNAYQLSSTYPAGQWQPAYAAYFARHQATRLSAEQIVDSLMTATGTTANISIYGMPGTLIHYSNQLPHPDNLNDSIESLLSSLGLGNWTSQPPSTAPSLFGILDLFNNFAVDNRIRSWTDVYTPQTRLSQWVAAGLSDSDIVRDMFAATLTRPPTAAELNTVLATKIPDRNIWLATLQWTLLQKLDFVFNY